ncbi:MAG: Slp family lipoprotein [Acidiferrobacter sp.]
MKTLWVLASLLLLAGCASRIPLELRQPHISQATVAGARAHLVPIGLRVRWGGIIAKVSNTPKATWIQIVSKPLRHDGRPRRRPRSDWRFLARVPGFLDPALYAVGRKITVVGVFSGYEKDPIGSYLYDFPVVHTLSSYLWRPRPVTPYYYSNPWPWGWGFGPGFGWGWRQDDDDGPYFAP